MILDWDPWSRVIQSDMDRWSSGIWFATWAILRPWYNFAMQWLAQFVHSRTLQCWLDLPEPGQLPVHLQIKPLILCIMLFLLIYHSTYLVVSTASQPVGTWRPDVRRTYVISIQQRGQVKVLRAPAPAPSIRAIWANTGKERPEANPAA